MFKGGDVLLKGGRRGVGMFFRKEGGCSLKDGGLFKGGDVLPKGRGGCSLRERGGGCSKAGGSRDWSWRPVEAPGKVADDVWASTLRAVQRVAGSLRSYRRGLLARLSRQTPLDIALCSSPLPSPRRPASSRIWTTAGCSTAGRQMQRSFSGTTSTTEQANRKRRTLRRPKGREMQSPPLPASLATPQLSTSLKIGITKLLQPAASAHFHAGRPGAPKATSAPQPWRLAPEACVSVEPGGRHRALSQQSRFESVELAGLWRAYFGHQRQRCQSLLVHQNSIRRLFPSCPRVQSDCFADPRTNWLHAKQTKNQAAIVFPNLDAADVRAAIAEW